jgi:hypothetical protein
MKRPDRRSGTIREVRTYVRALDGGVKLEAEISPCVFMYPGYPLQIQVTLRRHNGESLGVAYAVDRTKSAETGTPEDVRRLLAGIKTAPCPRCSTPAFDLTTVKTNRGGLCEPCFVRDWESDFAAIEQAERLKIAAHDRRMKQQGMTVRVTAWVHPDGLGDDYQVDWYFADPPTAAYLRKLLRAEGSTITDDYQITTL